MPFIYYNIDEQNSLNREPYKSLTKKFRNIKYALDANEIEIDIGGDKEGFINGFYTDFDFTNEAKLKFVFSKTDGNYTKNKIPGIFVGMLYSFECNENNINFTGNISAC